MMLDGRVTAEIDPALPCVVCIVGFKDTGKTSVAVRLVHELKRRGHRVAAVKHGHGFRIDTPGTDSWRLHHEGGATPMVLSGPDGYAVMGAWGPDGEADLSTLVRTHLRGAEVVIAEGFKHEPFPKIEVHRTGRHPRLIYDPLAPDAHRLLALVTDGTDLRADIPIFQFGDPETPGLLADLTEALLNRVTLSG